MIGVVASIVAGVILGEYVLFASPLVFLASLKNRDLGLIGYFLYALYSGSRVFVGDVYVYDELMRGLVFLFSMILLLEDVLRREIRVEKSEIVPMALLLGGFLLPESFIAGAMLYLLTLKPNWKVCVPVLGVLVAFAIFGEGLSRLGVSGQVIVFGSFTLFTIALAFLLKDVKRTEVKF
ncbi:hypothetical protein GBV73_02675 [Thermococcus sp. 101 C5]|uniref:hypothetical protein n=1 Tax=Thermococcus sp. 101 C5 TaxID=2654197 RepID=UPI00128DE09A|nr:hypothetical protein [Thermococcus sp. 101 C5]MPW38605.1 hypothetical protein [Thermococcus sp. 101 C5]